MRTARKVLAVMVKRFWWVVLASGLACSSAGQGSGNADDDARGRESTQAEASGANARQNGARQNGARGNETDLAPDDVASGARDELNLLETETGLVVQIERDGQLIERSCAGTCGDVCSGCLLEACQLSGIPSLCNAAADACENRCNACSGINAQSGTCEAPSCAGNLSCYFTTVGVPEEFLDVVRGVSSGPVTPQPGPDPAPVDRGAADPNAAAPNAESNSGQSSGEGSGQGSYY